MRLRISTPLAAAAAAGAIIGLTWSGDLAPAHPVDFFSSAHAIVGRPGTPVSVAGVARRTTRRAVVVGASAQPAPTTVVVAPAPTTSTVVVTPPPGYPPECIPVLEASTGKTYYRCP